MTRVGAKPIPSALNEESSRLKMITVLRPIRSAIAPPSALPIIPEMEKIPKMIPTVDMPMP